MGEEPKRTCGAEVVKKAVSSYNCKAAQEMLSCHYSVVNKSLKPGGKESSFSPSSGCSEWKSDGNSCMLA